jgi:hypothetical protein
VVWQQPIDNADGTFIRYLIFSNRNNVRDFYCVCRCYRVDVAELLPSSSPSLQSAAAASEAESAEVALAPERYVYAVTTLPSDLELVGRIGLPPQNAGIEHGDIYVCGILVTKIDEGSCLIEIMADVDPKLSSDDLSSDRQVRWHVLDTASTLHSELKKF